MRGAAKVLSAFVRGEPPWPVGVLPDPFLFALVPQSCETLRGPSREDCFNARTACADVSHLVGRALLLQGLLQFSEPT